MLGASTHIMQSGTGTLCTVPCTVFHGLFCHPRPWLYQAHCLHVTCCDSISHFAAMRLAMLGVWYTTRSSWRFIWWLAGRACATEPGGWQSGASSCVRGLQGRGVCASRPGGQHDRGERWPLQARLQASLWGVRVGALLPASL